LLYLPVEYNIKYNIVMNALKYLGILILLIGVVILTVPTIVGQSSNTFLLVGLTTIIVGFFAHIILNKKIE
jgi:uncharacterized membrane protein HdeD (DUF308 family)